MSSLRGDNSYKKVRKKKVTIYLKNQFGKLNTADKNIGNGTKIC
jgi:hypothetical protein